MARTSLDSSGQAEKRASGGRVILFPGCGPACEAAARPTPSLPSLNQPFIQGSLETPVGQVPVVSAELTRADRLGAAKVRLGIGRMKYTIEPGLYALGQPDKDSPVLVSANYKLSFDHLRRALPGRSAWILVLETKGINVWCAAGKGSFGTEELLSRLEESRLKELVAHRQLILPQLSGPGVAAHLVKKRSGFKVVYGPIRASDLPVFLDSGLKATPQMRRKDFPLAERAVLIPIELTHALKHLAWLAPALLFLGGLGFAGGYWHGLSNHGFFALTQLLGGLVAGSVLTPLLLPWLPGRAFSVKGILPGLAVSLALSAGLRPGLLEALGWLLASLAISAFLAMNFTGSSTYTSLSGVKKEMRLAVPLQIIAAGAGLAFWIAARFVEI